MVRRIFFGICLLLLACGVLGFSFIKFSAVNVGQDDHDVVGSRSADTRIQQLFYRPILPDHPLYGVKMLRDRIRLLLTPSLSRTFLDIDLANARLLSAQELIQRGRTGLSLTTATKAEKYLLSGVVDLSFVTPQERYNAVQNLENTITAHKEALVLMKASMRDDQRAVLDQLVQQLDVVKLSK